MDLLWTAASAVFGAGAAWAGMQGKVNQALAVAGDAKRIALSAHGKIDEKTAALHKLIDEVRLEVRGLCERVDANLQALPDTISARVLEILDRRRT